MVIMKTCNFLCCIELRWSHSCTKQAEQTIALFVSRFVIAARQVIFRGKQQVTERFSLSRQKKDKSFSVLNGSPQHPV